MVDESSYFSLVAIDTKGKEWRSERVHPLDIKSFSHGATVSAKLDEISSIQEISLAHKTASMTLTFNESIKIPCNVSTKVTKVIGEQEYISMSHDASVFTACEYEFLLKQREDTLAIEVMSNIETLPEKIDLRICEAFQFIFARSLSWDSLESYQGSTKTLRIRSRLANSPEKEYFSYPPIKFEKIDTDGFTWSLFEKYLNHVVHYSENRSHPISGWISTVAESEKSVLEIQALILSVAIEALANERNFRSLLPQKIDITSKIEDAIAIVDESKLEEGFKKRLKDSINNMKGIRAIDVLRNLAVRGFIEEPLIANWKSLRNKAAHASINANGEEIDKLFKACDAARVLFNHLIFLIIDYQGKYTDYSDGWVLKDFPRNN